MGCINSKPDAYDEGGKHEAVEAGQQGKKGASDRDVDGLKSQGEKGQPAIDPIPPAVAQAIQGSAFGGGAAAAAAAAAPCSPHGSNHDSAHAGVILGTPRASPHGSQLASQLVARANSRAGQYKKNSVGADLHSIMDDQGMLNPLVARQMSVMSHYSVRSESGSVLITPEARVQAEFKLIKLIGRGGFGNVYLGEWEDERVAVKIIQGYTNPDQDEQEWEARKERMAQMEAVLMSAIAHDNIVQTFKVIASQGEQVDPELAAVEKQLLKGHVPANTKEEEGLPSFEWHIIMEYCDKGSLSRALSTFMLHQPVDALNVKWDVWASLEILKEVVRSLIFLHQNRILHGDLKAANVLLTSRQLDRRKYIAKVSDFGLSRVLQNNKNHIKTQTFGTVTHVPPELLAKGTLSPKADVYAVGVLMWEIFTAEKVFKQLSDSEVILAVVTKKARPTFPSDVPSRFKFLAERCWSEMMELRPSLEVVMNELEGLQKNLCPEGQNSPPLVCRVYPTRQKVLAELVQKQKQYMQQQAAAAAAAAGRPQGSGGSATASPSRVQGSAASATGSPSRVQVAGNSPLAPTGSGAASPTQPQSPSRIAAFPASGVLESASTEKGTLAPAASTGQLQVAAREESYNASSQPLAQPKIAPGEKKRRSSTGRNLSPLAPQHVGTPERVNQDYSVQRPAEPRNSRSGSFPLVAADRASATGLHVATSPFASTSGNNVQPAPGSPNTGTPRERTVTFAPAVKDM